MNELTREQILAMPAGRELDMLVAEKVTDYRGNKDLFVWGYEACNENHYSSDIAAAKEVWFKFPVSEIERMELSEIIFKVNLWNLGDPDDKGPTYVEAETFELAICKAALLAVMGL